MWEASGWHASWEGSSLLGSATDWYSFTEEREASFGNDLKTEVKTRAALAEDWWGRQPTHSSAESELTSVKRTHRWPNKDCEGNPSSVGEVRPAVTWRHWGGHLTGYYVRRKSRTVEKASTCSISSTAIGTWIPELKHCCISIVHILCFEKERQVCISWLQSTYNTAEWLFSLHCLRWVQFIYIKQRVNNNFSKLQLYDCTWVPYIHYPVIYTKRGY